MNTQCAACTSAIVWVLWELCEHWRRQRRRRRSTSTSDANNHRRGAAAGDRETNHYSADDESASPVPWFAHGEEQERRRKQFCDSKTDGAETFLEGDAVDTRISRREEEEEEEEEETEFVCSAAGVMNGVVSCLLSFSSSLPVKIPPRLGRKKDIRVGDSEEMLTKNTE